MIYEFAMDRDERGLPACTGPSTNETCQPEKPENWYEETWGSTSTPGVETARPRSRISNQREDSIRRNQCNVADTRERGDSRCCQDKCLRNLERSMYGSPHWTRFELSRPKARSARTTLIAFRPMAYAQGWHTHPDWVPSKDYCRIPRRTASLIRHSSLWDRDGKHCGVFSG